MLLKSTPRLGRGTPLASGWMSRRKPWTFYALFKSMWLRRYTLQSTRFLFSSLFRRMSRLSARRQRKSIKSRNRQESDRPGELELFFLRCATSQRSCLDLSFMTPLAREAVSVLELSIMVCHLSLLSVSLRNSDQFAVESILVQALDVVSHCPCEDGCTKCGYGSKQSDAAYLWR